MRRWLCGAVAVVVLAGACSDDNPIKLSEPVALEDLRVGDCLIGPRIRADDCTVAHTLEFVGYDESNRELPGSAPYPTEADLARMADIGCARLARGYVAEGQEDPASVFSRPLQLPSAADWEAGERDVPCAVGVRDANGREALVVGSMRDESWAVPTSSPSS